MGGGGRSCWDEVEVLTGLTSRRMNIPWSHFTAHSIPDSTGGTQKEKPGSLAGELVCNDETSERHFPKEAGLPVRR